MEAIRLETTVQQDGTLAVPGVRAGESAEVIALFKSQKANAYPFRGTGGHFRRPFDPVIPESDM